MATLHVSARHVADSRRPGTVRRWRKGRESNPRPQKRGSGLANQRLEPLGHPSFWCSPRDSNPEPPDPRSGASARLGYGCLSGAPRGTRTPSLPVLSRTPLPFGLPGRAARRGRTDNLPALNRAPLPDWATAANGAGKRSRTALAGLEARSLAARPCLRWRPSQESNPDAEARNLDRGSAAWGRWQAAQESNPASGALEALLVPDRGLWKLAEGAGFEPAGHCALSLSRRVP